MRGPTKLLALQNAGPASVTPFAHPLHCTAAAGTGSTGVVRAVSAARYNMIPTSNRDSKRVHNFL